MISNYATEINYDGLVGPTHNYAGLSFGNLASINNAGIIANPRQAAHQGLDKMRTMLEMGVAQAVLPPQQRPNSGLLRNLGFMGNEHAILQQAYEYNPSLLAACYSASSMWAANMATISPSCNTADNKVHITPANLSYTLHRAQEAEFSYKLLQQIFADQKHFVVHSPLPGYRDLSDEGAANHTALCAEYARIGIELFIYGRDGFDDLSATQKYPARQARLASAANIRNHGLNPQTALLIQQNPAVIDAGVFHNDVICVGNKNVLFYHADAFINWEKIRDHIKNYFAEQFHFLEVSSDVMSVAEAIKTYIFNAQLVSLPDDTMALVVPMECKASNAASNVLHALLEDSNPISVIKYVECHQSMLNGGGPACLRLRVQLTGAEIDALTPNLFLTPELYAKLSAWIERHYRDRLAPVDLLDPLLPAEVMVALDELTKILQLGSIYPFQR